MHSTMSPSIVGHSPVPGDATECSVPGPCHMWREPDAQLPQQHRPQEGLQTPAGKWGMFCCKTSLGHHTALSPNPGSCSSQEKWDTASFGEFWGTGTLRGFSVKCSIILTCSLKAGPTVCDSSNERQLSMYLERACTGQTHMKLKFMHQVYCQHSVLSTESTERDSYGIKTVLLPIPGSHFGTSFQPISTTGIFTIKFYIYIPHKGCWSPSQMLVFLVAFLYLSWLLSGNGKTE